MTSIGQDLAIIRIHLNLTLDDIHRATRIPLVTLKRIENGSIFHSREENNTYIRSFVRAYAKALKIDEELVLESLDQFEAGTYEQLLLKPFPEVTGKGTIPYPLLDDSETSPGTRPGEPAKPDADSSSAGKTDPATDAGSAAASGSAASGAKASGSAASGAKASSPDPGSDAASGTEAPSPDPGSDAASGTETPSPDSGSGPAASQEKKGSGGTTGKPGSDAADTRKTADEKAAAVTPPSRPAQTDWAEMGKKFRDNEKSTPVWIIGMALVVVITFASIYFISSSGLFSRNSPDTEAGSTALTGTGSSSELDIDLIEPEETPPPPALEDTLYLTLYAAYDKLEPVRVWTDLKPRIDAYWLERGEAYHFEFRDSIRVSGQYGRMLLFLNGHRIDSHRQDHFNQQANAVELTRGLFEESIWASPVPLDLPDDAAEPDTLRYRPVF